MTSNSVYESWTLPAIREELKKRNANVFEFYDTIYACGTTEPEFKMDVPCQNKYKDAHVGMTGNFPQFTMKRLTEYLSLYCRDFDPKCKDMYEERYLRCYRVCTNPENGLTFILSIVWAEMKKSVTYKVDLSLYENGVVQEVHCKCGAKQVPSALCKHFVTVLYASFRVFQAGIVLSELSCTQVLQTFHKANSHKGSPLKAHHLQTICGKI
ncbi:hypothetical protein ACJMK2_011906 [Sinanodonta woodiana]|uniref:SWIM-type domain-containing protein n=1 Tax=Sinanodonta woodiana TaxID=1069815 RepID=A0ABD3V6H0_SINWO